MINYILYGWFSVDGVGKTGLLPTVDLRDNSGALVVTDGQTLEIGGGFYGFAFTSEETRDYLGVFKTSDVTVDAKHFPSLYPAQMIQIDEMPENVRSELATIPAVELAYPKVGAEIETIAGDTIDFDMDVPGSLVGVKKVYLGLKRRYADADSASILMFEDGTGLLYVNGAAATANKGSITVLEASPSRIHVHLDASESAKIEVLKYYYDIKVIETNDDAVTRTQGEWEFKPAITKATS